MDEVAAVKQAQQATWAAGDYDAVAELIMPVGRSLVQRLAPVAGEDVLDVACGTGNATIPAAETGARVIGSDLTPGLFEAGRARAARAGVEIEWREADAEELPFEDASFDVVMSTFGCMFAPRHEVAAAELARVLRPGGRLGVCAWTPEGNNGVMFKTVSDYMPPPPEWMKPPVMWGTDDHCRGLFEGTGVELEFDRETVRMPFASPREAVEHFGGRLGPFVKAREALEPQGRWDALVEDLVRLFEDRGEPAGDGIEFPAEYLVVLGRGAGPAG